MTSSRLDEVKETVVLDEDRHQYLQAEGLYTKIAAGALTVIGIASAAFHIWTAGAGPLPGFKQTTIHVAFAALICLLNFRAVTGAKPPKTNTGRRVDQIVVVAEICVVVVATVYVWYEFDRIVHGLGYARPTGLDILIGTLIVAVVFDACRRSMGLAFPIIGAITILYCLYGDELPGILGHSGLTYQATIANSFTSPLGIYGNVTATSATQIAIFVIFGALLMKLGGGDGFLKLALVVAGRFRGGPGKVSVLSSALFGMVNGSAVANTASTGAITIPLMKRYGFSSRLAAGVESTASTGGQWTPPIMGAAVFLMAQLLGMSYYSVVLAAIIPAIIYYVSFWFTIDAEARKKNLQGLESEDIPKIRSFLDEITILLPCVAILITFIIMGYPVRMAGFSAVVVLLVTATLVHLFWKKCTVLQLLEKIMQGCRDGAITAATIGVLVAGSQVVVAGIGTTGVALSVGSVIFSLATVSIFVALLVAALINILLGLALPTVPSYLIAVSITGAALIELGASPLSVHLFALYFAVIGGITPPIGATVFVAAAIAQTGWFRVSLTALRIACISIVLPFVFVLRPELLLEGSVGSTATTALFTVGGGVVLAWALARFMQRNLSLWESAVLLALAGAMFYPNTLVNIAGLAGSIAMVLWFISTARKMREKEESSPKQETQPRIVKER